MKKDQELQLIDKELGTQWHLRINAYLRGKPLGDLTEIQKSQMTSIKAFILDFIVVGYGSIKPEEPTRNGIADLLLTNERGQKILIEWKVSKYSIEQLISETPLINQVYGYWDKFVEKVYVYIVNTGDYKDITRMVLARVTPPENLASSPNPLTPQLCSSGSKSGIASTGEGRGSRGLSEQDIFEQQSKLFKNGTYEEMIWMCNSNSKYKEYKNVNLYQMLSEIQNTEKGQSYLSWISNNVSSISQNKGNCSLMVSQSIQGLHELNRRSLRSSPLQLGLGRKSETTQQQQPQQPQQQKQQMIVVAVVAKVGEEEEDQGETIQSYPQPRTILVYAQEDEQGQKQNQQGEVKYPKGNNSDLEGLPQEIGVEILEPTQKQ